MVLLKKTLILLFFFCLCIGNLLAQEVSAFSVLDFDLKGPVKKCVVITKYGQEQYLFNEKRQLISAATIFSKKDSETAYYKYSKGRLIERRIEIYTNGVLDKKTSLANFYTYDSIPNLRIKEKIMNYNREFIDQFNYKYDSIGDIFQEIRTNIQGRYVTDIKRDWNSLKTQSTIRYLLDSVLLKQIDSFFVPKTRSIKKSIVKEFSDGYLKKETRSFFNKKNLETQNLVIDFEQKDSSSIAVLETKIISEYNPIGNPIKMIIIKGVTSQTKNFLYQLDGSPHKNWIKKITTPDNTYTTRIITYFK
jgi:hypothetical protein